MRIISWNCNLRFSEKFSLLQEFHPDITIIQECEWHKQDFFSGYEYFWVGNNKKKGLGILVSQASGKILDTYNDKLIHFLPISLRDINILGVWAFNHRAKRISNDFNGNPIDVLNYYSDFLKEPKEISVIAGDFNNSLVFDKPNASNPNAFKSINSQLKALGYSSSYHHLNDEKFSMELKPTFFHTKNKNKPFHIDYIYTRGQQPTKIEVGSYKDWIEYSDHMPLILEY